MSQETYTAASMAAMTKGHEQGSPSEGHQESSGSLFGVQRNVGQGERLVSLAAGSLLALFGLKRRDLSGLAIAGLGGALAYRGYSGHCAAYDALRINTAQPDETDARFEGGVHVLSSFLINKPADILYAFWRNFENLPQFMTHLESVENRDQQRSHWIAKAPSIYGGRVEWDAEITVDEPNSKIAWQTLPESQLQHRGSVTFTKAPGARGTCVKAELDYQPPAGQLGRWVAKLFGEEPEQQIHDDLRNFKRIMEVGELPSTAGQSRGTCSC